MEQIKVRRSNRKTEQEIIFDHSYIVGQKFGKLTVIEVIAGKNRLGHKTPFFVCRCDCGNKKVVALKRNLTEGHIKSCGCSMNFRLPWGPSYHGYSGEKIYGVWHSMVGRCLNPNVHSFPNYGGRGITVCKDWTGEDGYINFRKWSYENGYSDGLTIDRIDNDKGYSPENCRWTDIKTQSYNKRVPRTSESGVRGVAKRKDSGRWQATVSIGGRCFRIGHFDSLEEAAAARNRYIRENDLPNLPSYIPGTKEEY